MSSAAVSRRRANSYSGTPYLRRVLCRRSKRVCVVYTGIRSPAVGPITLVIMIHYRVPFFPRNFVHIHVYQIMSLNMFANKIHYYKTVYEELGDRFDS